MGNTVGSKFNFKSAEDYYILGLWLADGYWYSSSIGLTSVNSRLIDRFTKFLFKINPNFKIKKRTYKPNGINKHKQIAIQVYVNNRPLTRLFMSMKTGVLKIPSKHLLAYLAGRIDGDGHIDSKYRSGIRIAYSSNEDALRDQLLFGETNVSLYQYKTAKTFVLYLKKHYRDIILSKLKLYSVKLAP